ncbi:hypothetical protein [Rhizobium sp. CNPSo 4039]|jgi:hypothetical protein|uniref:hypothetical protein n=1 Tax=Rhizobium sp. CNPSo 4039 TaxID=3021409 RepID=UPI0013AEBFD2|nr:hypothetical protein [Rhizobium sp. CNPSo 4039]MDK4717612.1 hypothetical protein [Rhizobium sp. CNPSo 4039]
MEKSGESEILKLLRGILRDGVYEVDDYANIDRKTMGVLAQALSLRVIRADRIDWDGGVRFLLTDDGRRALGLQIDWWMPEDLREKVLPETERTLSTQSCDALIYATTTRPSLRRSQGSPMIEHMPTTCLIGVVCGIMLMLVMAFA